MTPNLELLTASAFAGLAPVVAVILLQSTILLSLGLAAALLVGPHRLTLLSLLYRSLLVGVALITVVAIAPTNRFTTGIRPLLSLSLPTSQPVQSDDFAASVQTSPVVASANKNFAPQSPSPQGKTVAIPEVTASSVPVEPLSSGHPGWPMVALVSLLFVVAAGKLIWLVLAGCYTARLRRGHVIEEPVTLDLLRQSSAQLHVATPLLVEHPRVQIPFLSGLLRPVIALPAGYQNDFDATALKAILLHELAHLARRDCWWKHFASIIGAVLWFQPLVWLLRYRLEQIDESLCDETVLRGGCSPRSYASLLLDMSQQLSRRPLEQVSGAGIVAFRSALGKRIQRIMESPREMGAPISARVRLLTLGSVMVVVTTAMTLLRVDAAPERSATPTSDASRTSWIRRIPRDDTPEVKVGLPATVEEAVGNSTITGRVLYSNGKPAAGLRVEVYNYWLSQTELWGYHRNFKNHYRWPDKVTKLLSAKGVTRADGSYRLTGLLAQRYGVHVQSDRLGNRAPAGWLAPERGSRVVAVANQSRKAADIVLRPSAQIRIRTVDVATGAPLESVLWRGFNVDETVTDQPRSMSVTAQGGMRPLRGDDSQKITDKNGVCVLSLDEGKANFFMFGGDHMGSTPQDPAKTGHRFAMPDLILTSQGVYKSVDWCQVTAPGQAPRRAWKGDTDVVLKTGQVVNFTVGLKRYRALTAKDRMILNAF